MTKNLIFLLLFLLCSRWLSAATPDLVQYVNTLQGTNSTFDLTRGNTYPTTALPFAMHTWTPQTGVNGDGWKYQYHKDSIRGFQQAHQCSSWTNDYAVFSLMPVTGQLAVDQYSRAAAFKHENETAKPHYYKVKLENNITTEMSPTERGVHIRFTFPKNKDAAYVVLDGYTGMSQVQICPKERKITGYVHNGRGLQKNFKNYFVIVFDKPFVAQGTWKNRNKEISQDKLEDEGRGVGAFIQFRNGEAVQARIASSYISQEQAELNLEKELGKHKKLEDTKTAAANTWNTHLARVMVEGGTEEEKATFYSCFFRASLFSRKFFEYDRKGEPYYFSPYDGRIYRGYMYTDTGFWDTFRAQFPLNTILHPTMHGQYVSAMLDAQEQCGWLPSWSFPGEAGSMVGNHAISLFADAWVKGIRTFDPGKALDAYYHEATNKGPWGPANGREGWKEYFTLGFVPYPQVREATAKTLEYAYDDFCGYQLAKVTDNAFYENVFGKQMYNYRNLYDPATRFMRGKKADGAWVENFDPVEWGGPYTEGNAWHYHWSVFQDVQGLINLMEGEKNFTAKLDSVFTVPNTVKVGTYGRMIHEMTEMVMADMGQYAHGNQPIQHMIYLYNYAREPWKAQKWARTVMDKLYSSTEDGYPGDEDQGQTSSWYVLSALGFYSVTPGTDQYVFGSPVFGKATVTLENGKKFTVEAVNNSKDNVYIQSATLNGKPYTRNWISHADIVNGGILRFVMGNKPALDRGQQEEDKPFSLSKPIK
ncbi:GH92 family glycosyl hydrolase [Pontibacter sp. SGAir0037]|uniref:GH92 family glycosyl hydrolase n=1 Tax=Pontibacter sp. SGAir0037 TaxID=2571030 RepID=UPI0010CD057D|nr:GH92 family glycosyl hydrolase [Pontibacter sp. SGAir0037]QCR21164.1 alpha-mannosidase [Pontibacter sp. SGAir0037]